MNLCKTCGKPCKNKFCDRSCFRKFCNALRKKPRKEIETICKKCSNVFKQIIKEDSKSNYLKSFCSRKCANSKDFKLEKNKYKNVNCYKCGTSLIVLKRLSKTNAFCKECHEKNIELRKVRKKINDQRAKKSFCKNCNKLIHKRRSGHCKKCYSKSEYARKNHYPKLGIKRSKNEIYFFELCKKVFDNVLNNQAIFNGWDADVLQFYGMVHGITDNVAKNIQ